MKKYLIYILAIIPITTWIILSENGQSVAEEKAMKLSRIYDENVLDNKVISKTEFRGYLNKAYQIKLDNEKKYLIDNYLGNMISFGSKIIKFKDDTTYRIITNNDTLEYIPGATY
jgi:hypothetical protein